MKIKEIIKKYVPQSFFYFVKDIVYPEKIAVLEDRLNTLFFKCYQDIADQNLSQKVIFKNAEFKIYSKHGGDGILAYIFSKIGATNRIFVEMGVENGTECNTANLSFNFGWNGLMIDANEEFIKFAKDFFRKKLGNCASNVKLVASFITAENINKTITDNGISGDIDLLSIDIDGNDYRVWESITVVNPRVVVMEYNAAFGLKSVIIKYDADFYFRDTHRDSPLYFGASLVALSKLAKEKGYILVACDCHGHDAFFVRQDVAEGKFIELSPEEIFYPNPFTLNKVGNLEKQFEMVKDQNLEEI